MKRWLRVCLAAFILALILCAGSALADTLFCTVCDDRTPAIFVENTYHDSDGHTVIQKCAKCGEYVLAHHVCKACGSYDGKEVVKKDA